MTIDGPAKSFIPGVKSEAHTAPHRRSIDGQSMVHQKQYKFDMCEKFGFGKISAVSFKGRVMESHSGFGLHIECIWESIDRFQIHFKHSGHSLELLPSLKLIWHPNFMKRVLRKIILVPRPTSRCPIDGS